LYTKPEKRKERAVPPDSPALETTIDSRPVLPSAVTATLAPADARERIFAIDALRGFALLGILLMNLPALAMPFQAHYDPTVPGFDTRANFWIWVINALLIEGKMRAIFSMLYGASVVLLTSRLEQRGAGSQVADIYYRRTLWLILFGMAHICFVWGGDILFIFGVCGLILFPLRKVAPKYLIVTGLLMFSLLAVRRYADDRALHSMREKAMEANAAEADGKTLTEEQRQVQKAWTEKLKEYRPSQSAIAEDISDHRGSYWKQFARRAQDPGISFTLFGFPCEAAGMMLIGMALLKLGVFSAERSYREYALMAFFGFGIGLPLAGYVIWRNVQDNFSPCEFFSATCCGPMTSPTYDLERLFVGLGWVALVMLVLKGRLIRWLTSCLAAVGRMALTDYLMQTTLCVLIFDGVGFGLYGRLQRPELLLYILLPIWLFQLVFSPIWLRYFRFGPMEWLWRSLTYWKLQRMRISVPAAKGQAAVAEGL
jgi:uncharacterized protein